MNTESPLRAALRELADVPPPADLAGRALDRARRDRRRGLVALVAGAAVLAAAAVTVPAVVLDRAAPTTAAAARPRLVVLGFASRDPEPPGLADGDVQVYRSGRYATTRWRSAVPSPDRTAVAVSPLDRGQPGIVGIVPADRVDDPSAVRWIPNLLNGAPEAWSADGRYLLVRQPTRIGSGSAPYGVVYTSLVVDVATLATRTVRIALPERHVAVTRVLFGPNGRGFVVPTLDRGRDRGGSSYDLLRLADDQGKVIREFRVGTAVLPDQPFSPDGRRIVLSSGRARVLDLATGEEAAPVTGRAAGWYDDRSYLVMSGSSLRRIELSTGRVLGQWELPTSGRTLTRVWLGRLDGAPPPGAVVL